MGILPDKRSNGAVAKNIVASVLAGVVVVLAGGAQSARADKLKSYSAWQAEWKSGLAGTRASCLKIEETRGTHCGESDSLGVDFTNTCSDTVRVSYCLERSNGKLDCGLDSKLKPGTKNNGAWTCHGSGKWRMLACDVDEGCRADADVYLGIKDSSVVLTSCVEEALGKVGEALFAATGRGIVITDGTRTPRRQAEEMHKKLSAGEKLRFREAALAKEIQDAWTAIPAEDRPTKGQDVIEAVIVKQVAAKKFVSRHLSKNGADIRTRDLSESDEAKLVEILGKHGIEILEEPSAAGGEHIHANVVSCK
jgi:hypothetical protein